jgi:proteasome lid subunit RPN8/RPN11
MSLKSCKSLQNVHKTISDQNRISYDINKAQGQMLKSDGIYQSLPTVSHCQLQMAFSQSSSYDNVTVAITERHQQRIKNGRLTSSNTLYREVL